MAVRKHPSALHNQSLITNAPPALNGYGHLLDSAAMQLNASAYGGTREPGQTAEKVLFQAIFDNSLDAMLITSPDGKIHRANAEACRLLGRSEEEIRRIGRSGIVNERDRAVLRSLAERDRAGRLRWNMMHRRGNGTEFLAEVSSAVFQDSEGLEKTIVVLRDITERQKAEEALTMLARFRQSLLDILPARIALLDSQGRIMAVNERWSQFARENPSRKEQAIVVGANLLEMIQRAAQAGDPYAERPAAGLPEVLAGRCEELEWEYPIEDCRQERWFLVKVVPAPELGGAAMVQTDITEHKRAEAEWERLAAIVESSMDAIIGVDVDGTILTWNPGAERLYGYTEEEVRGKTVAILFPPERLAEQQQLLERVRRGEKVVLLDTTRLAKGNRLVTVSVALSPTWNRAGQVVGISCIARDISERKRAEAEREQLIANLQKALAEVKTLKGLLAICSSCKKIRDDKGNWSRMEVYLSDRSEAQFTHGMCPDCAKQYFSDYLTEGDDGL